MKDNYDKTDQTKESSAVTVLLKSKLTVPRTLILEPPDSILYSIEYRVSSLEDRVSSLEYRVPSRER